MADRTDWHTSTRHAVGKIGGTIGAVSGPEGQRISACKEN